MDARVLVFSHSTLSEAPMPDSTDPNARIEVNPAVLGGKPVVRGTRIAVEWVVDLLAHAWTEKQVLDNYPALAAEDVRACVEYAAKAWPSGRGFPATNTEGGAEPPAIRD
jgi:uncharacterized protein (DUF433 family)